jgi:hypothetical protein
MSRDLTNDRVTLREFKKSDWVDVHKYASQEIVCRYQPWGPNTEEESQSFVNQVLLDATQGPRTRYVFAIIHKEDGNMIGTGEINIRDIQNRNGEISYIVNPTYWGKGIVNCTPIVRHDLIIGGAVFKTKEKEEALTRLINRRVCLKTIYFKQKEKYTCLYMELY